MRKVARIMVCVCFLTGLALAQTNDAAAPSKEDVLKFMDVLHIRQQLVQYFDGVAKQARLGAEEGFKQKVPDATPEQLAKVDQFSDNLLKGMPIDEMIDAMVPIYQKHLTKDDIAGILAFYASPVGQKLQREQPAMMQEGMQAGGEIGRRKVGAMMQQLEDFITKMAQEQQKPAKP